jgi:serine protease Do
MKSLRSGMLFGVLFTVVVLAGAVGLQACDSGRPGPSAPATAQSQPAQAVDTSQIHQLMTEISDAFERAARRVSVSVVPIYAEQVVVTQGQMNLPDDSFKDFFGQDFFRRFFEAPSQPQKQTVRSLGSGVIVSKDGHILTNNHVVHGASKLTVMLGDKKSYDAKILGTDPQSDVAVIKINAENLPVATLGDSDKVKVGQWVIAVGNPFALMHTVTHGIISAKGRSSVGLAAYEDFIQTDAPINPGNSGGALADLDGNVVAINTAISTPSGGNVGLGFAIPINMARTIMDDLLTKGKVVRGYLGLIPQDIDDSLAKALKLPDSKGALISQVTPGGPADRAGIKVGDVIVEFAGKKVGDSNELRNDVAQAAPGTDVKIAILRDGRRMEVTAKLVERPKSPTEKPAPGESPEGQTSRKLGLSVQTLTPDIAQQLGYGNDKGAVVASVDPGSPADDAGLQAGDLIKEVNRAPIATSQDFEKAIRGLRKGDSAALLVRRGAASFFLALKIQ